MMKRRRRPNPRTPGPKPRTQGSKPPRQPRRDGEAPQRQGVVCGWITRELGMPAGVVDEVLRLDPDLVRLLAAAEPARAQREPREQCEPREQPEIRAEPQRIETAPEVATRVREIVPEAVAPSPGPGPGQMATPRPQEATPAQGPSEQTSQPMQMLRPGLSIPQMRPGFAEQPDGEYVQTPGGFTIEIANYDIRIYDPDGRRQTRIWGDPHVNEGEGGDDWHFGQDSTFVLTDGTKICLDTEPNSAGEWYVVGADILAGTSRYHFGVGDEAGMTGDALEFDKAHADRAHDESAGVFAMAADGQWAVQAPDGHFYDINTETWAAYQGDRDIDFDPAKRIQLTDDQIHATAYDHIPGYVPPPIAGEWANGEGGKGPASMRLSEPRERPSYLRFSGSQIVRTPDGYTVEMQAPEVIIHGREGQCITRIWGDPHVDEGGEGTSEWHFGQDSTFILPDGTKISLDTEPNSAGEWYVVGVDVTLGATRFHHGVGGSAGMATDGLEWDRAHADRALDESAGVFALQENGQWAVMAPDGHFYDITEESWAQYQGGDRDIDFDPSLRADLTVQQQFAARSDQLPGDMRIPALGQIPDLDWLGNETTLPPLGMMSEAEAVTVLQRYMPIWHINLIRARAPLLLPMIAEDKYLAQHLAEIPLRKLKEMLSFLPPNLLRKPGTAGAATEERRVRRDFDRSFAGWSDLERTATAEDASRFGREAWWLRSGSFAR